MTVGTIQGHRLSSEACKVATIQASRRHPRQGTRGKTKPRNPPEWPRFTILHVDRLRNQEDRNAESPDLGSDCRVWSSSRSLPVTGAGLPGSEPWSLGKLFVSIRHRLVTCSLSWPTFPSATNRRYCPPRMIGLATNRTAARTCGQICFSCSMIYDSVSVRCEPARCQKEVNGVTQNTETERPGS